MREKTMLEADLEIILACGSDLDRILEIYQIAKEYMRKNRNPNQWNGSYPDRETLQVDIEKQRLYVCKKEDMIYGVFVLLLEKELRPVLLFCSAFLLILLFFSRLIVPCFSHRNRGHS